jgi:hypothetical protein
LIAAKLAATKGGSMQAEATTWEKHVEAERAQLAARIDDVLERVHELEHELEEIRLTLDD